MQNENKQKETPTHEELLMVGERLYRLVELIKQFEEEDTKVEE